MNSDTASNNVVTIFAHAKLQKNVGYIMT